MKNAKMGESTEAFQKTFVQNFLDFAHLESIGEGDVIVQCSDGEVKEHSLILGSLSPLLKDYLKFIDETTIKEPMIVLPDLQLEDYLLYTNYLLSPNVNEIYKEEDVNILKRTARALFIDQFEEVEVDEPELMQVDFVNEDPVTPPKRSSFKSKSPKKYSSRKRKIPAILSQNKTSRYGRIQKASSKVEDDIDRRSESPPESVDELLEHFQPELDLQTQNTEERGEVRERNPSALSCAYCDKRQAHYITTISILLLTFLF